MADKSFPGFWQGVGELVKLLIATVAGTLVFGTIIERAGLSTENAAVAGTMLGALAGYGIVLRQGLRFGAFSLKEVIPFKAPSPAAWFGLFPAALGLSILGSEVDNALRFFIPVPERLQQGIVDISHPKIWMGLAAVSVLVVFPLLEEIFFRGFMLHGFLNRYPAARAILGSAALYSLFQSANYPWQIPATLMLGLFLAWVVWVTGSIWPAVLGHAFVGGIPILMARLGWRITGFNTAYGRTVKFQPLWFDGLGASLLLAGLAALTLVWYLAPDQRR